MQEHIPKAIETEVRRLVGLLVAADYRGMFQMCPKSRARQEDLVHAVQEYGRTFVMPSGALQLDVISVSRAVVPQWSVVAPLWTVEDGLSDLSLELIARKVGARVELAIDDLRAR